MRVAAHPDGQEHPEVPDAVIAPSKNCYGSEIIRQIDWFSSTMPISKALPGKAWLTWFITASKGFYAIALRVSGPR